MYTVFLFDGRKNWFDWRILKPSCRFFELWRLAAPFRHVKYLTQLIWDFTRATQKPSRCDFMAATTREVSEIRMSRNSYKFALDVLNLIRHFFSFKIFIFVKISIDRSNHISLLTLNENVFSIIFFSRWSLKLDKSNFFGDSFSSVSIAPCQLTLNRSNSLNAAMKWPLFRFGEISSRGKNPSSYFL